MSNRAFTAQGSGIFINSIEVGEAVEFGGPTVSRPQVDVTHLKSTSREFKAGLRDNGEFSFSVNYIPTDAGQIEIRRALDVEAEQEWRVELPPEIVGGPPRETWTFMGAVTGAELQAGVDEPMRLDVTVRVSGAVTYDPPITA